MAEAWKVRQRLAQRRERWLVAAGPRHLFLYAALSVSALAPLMLNDLWYGAAALIAVALLLDSGDDVRW